MPARPMLLAALAALSTPAAGQLPLLHHFDGPSAGQQLGTAVSGAGDVDQDGRADVILGATDGNGASPRVGLAQVYSGRDGRLLHTFRGNAAGRDAFGAAVGGAGDVNRDGFDDLVVGARYDSTRAIFAGAVRVYSGRDGRLLHEFLGEAEGDRLGASVAGAGDVDGDGHADVVAGAHFANANGFWSGSVYVFSGRDGRRLWVRHGDGAFHFLGIAVDGAGDLDRDGLADVIAGADGADTAAVNGGMVRAFSGRDGRVLFTGAGTVPGGGLGSAVSSVGDVDHDGHPDLIAGAGAADTANGPRSGMALLLSGRNGSVLRTCLGDDAEDGFGFAVAGAGDVNGDGTPDCVVGAPFDERGGAGAGSVTVLSGADGTRIAAIQGTSAEDRFGAAVGGAGDANGDGFADLVIGAPFDDDRAADAGSARILAVGGARPYGAASGGPARLALGWLPGAPVAAGTLEVAGAGPLAVGGVLLGVARTSQQIGPLTLLLDLGSGPWLFLPLLFDQSGRAALPVSLREPALAESVLYAQAVEAGVPSLSNGLGLLFAR